MVPGVTSDLQTKRIALIHKRLAAVQREESLSNCTFLSVFFLNLLDLFLRLVSLGLFGSNSAFLDGHLSFRYLL
jgi:hypothetical protein